MCVDIELVCMCVNHLERGCHTIVVRDQDQCVYTYQPIGNHQHPASSDLTLLYSTSVTHVPTHVTSYHAVNPASSARRNLVFKVHIRASLDEHLRGGFVAFAKGEHDRCLIVLRHE